MLTIESAHPEDRTAVLRLWDRVGLGESSEREWHALHAQASATVLVAREEDGALIGTAVASFDGWRAYIYHVAVLPERQHQGVGRALMAHAERRLARAGARHIYLSVHEGNVAGLALAGAVGYVPNGDVELIKMLASDARAEPAEDARP